MNSGVPDLCRELGISSATFYKWRAKYGGMDTSMMSRMKELEDENRRLRGKRLAFGRRVFVYLFNSELMLARLKQKWQVVC